MKPPESLKYFFPPYCSIVYALMYVLSLVGIFVALNGHMMGIALVFFCLISYSLFSNKVRKVRHQYMMQFIKGISLEKKRVSMKVRGKEVIFTITPREKKEDAKWNKP